MFTYCHKEYCEVDLPLEKVWEFCSNPANTPKWIDQFESCTWEGELKKGTVLQTKFKNRNLFLTTSVKEYNPYSEITIFHKNILGS